MVRLTQIQDEIINAAASQSHLNPATFARLLLHDLDDVHAAIKELVKQGLVAAADGDTFRLTDQGAAVHRAQEDAHRAAVNSRTRTWQPR